MVTGVQPEHLHKARPHVGKHSGVGCHLLGQWWYFMPARLHISSHPAGAVYPAVIRGCITWRQVCRQCRIVALHAEGFMKGCVTCCTAVLQLAVTLCCGRTARPNGGANSTSKGVRLRVCSRVATAAHEAMSQVCNPVKEQRDRHMVCILHAWMHPCCLNVHSKETAPKACALRAPLRLSSVASLSRRPAATHYSGDS